MRNLMRMVEICCALFFMLPIKMSPKKEEGQSSNSRAVLKNEDCFLITLKIKIRIWLKQKISVIIFLAIYICVLSAESWSPGKINEAWCVLRFLHRSLESSTSGKWLKFLHCSSILLWMISKLRIAFRNWGRGSYSDFRWKSTGIDFCL